MYRNCLKCGHANHEASGDELEACPSCGAIYSRVEAAWGTRPTVSRAPRPTGPAAGEAAAGAGASSPAPSPTSAARGAGAAEVSVEVFAERLRLASLYPTFRGLVELLYWVVVLLAVLMFVGGMFGAWAMSGTGSFASFVSGLVFGVFFLVVARVTREMSLMLADLADAAVRIASRVRP